MTNLPCGREHRRRECHTLGVRTINVEEKYLVRHDGIEVWMVSCSTSGRPVLKGIWRDQAVELMCTLSELQSVEDR